MFVWKAFCVQKGASAAEALESQRLPMHPRSRLHSQKGAAIGQNGMEACGARATCGRLSPLRCEFGRVEALLPKLCGLQAIYKI